MAFPVHWYLEEMCMTYGPKFPLKDSCRTHGISYRLPSSYKTHRCPEGPPAGNKQLYIIARRSKNWFYRQCHDIAIVHHDHADIDH